MTSHVFSPDYKLNYPNLHGPPPSEYTLNTLHWKFFHRSTFLNNLHLPWKTVLPEFFHCIDYILFVIQDFWATCACPEKQILPEIIHCIEVLLSFRNFEQLVFALKFFTVLNILLTFRIFEQLALALKNRVCVEFTYWMRIFYHSGILSNLHLPWKQNLPWKISSREAAAAPPATRFVRVWVYCIGDDNTISYIAWKRTISKRHE